MNTVGHALTITILSVLFAAHLLIDPAETQPCQSKPRFNRQRPLEFADGIFATAQFVPAKRQVLPPPYVPRIQLENMLKCHGGLLEFLLVHQSHAKNEPALRVSGKQVKRA